MRWRLLEGQEEQADEKVHQEDGGRGPAAHMGNVGQHCRLQVLPAGVQQCLHQLCQ